jgi:hypothetical protein
VKVTNIGVLIVFASAILAGVIFGWSLNWPGLSFSVSVQDIPNLLGPIAFAAAVVERSVEILISPWRDAGANKLENQIAAIKKRQTTDPAALQSNALELQQTSDQLEEYRAQTQRYAFVVSFLLSIMASISGFRALEPFLGGIALVPANTKPLQPGFFYFVDILLSATVMAGGADGIHSIVNAITSFFDNTAEKKPQPPS